MQLAGAFLTRIECRQILLWCADSGRMPGDELPAPLPLNDDVREPALAGDLCAFDHSFSRHAAGDHGRLVIDYHFHFINVIRD